MSVSNLLTEKPISWQKLYMYKLETKEITDITGNSGVANNIIKVNEDDDLEWDSAIYGLPVRYYEDNIPHGITSLTFTRLPLPNWSPNLETAYYYIKMSAQLTSDVDTTVRSEFYIYNETTSTVLMRGEHITLGTTPLSTDLTTCQSGFIKMPLTGVNEFRVYVKRTVAEGNQFINHIRLMIYKESVVI